MRYRSAISEYPLEVEINLKRERESEYPRFEGGERVHRAEPGVCDARERVGQNNLLGKAEGEREPAPRATLSGLGPTGPFSVGNWCRMRLARLIGPEIT